MGGLTGVNDVFVFHVTVFCICGTDLYLLKYVIKLKFYNIEPSY